MPPLPPLHPSLLVATLYLVFRAQVVKSRNILDVWDALRDTRWPQAQYSPGDVQRSVLFICAIAGRLGMLNSCLVRALVAGRLLLGHDDVVLHVGIHTQGQGGAPGPTGHAWVECCGRNLSDPLDQALPEDLRVTHSIKLSSGR